MRLQISRAGQTADGRKISEKNLKEAAANFVADVPVVFGHMSVWNDSLPAAGWVTGLEYSRKHLIANIDLLESTKARMDAGEYKNVSAGFSLVNRSDENPGEWKLHHLALLGAAPPAVEGLKIIEHATDVELITFEMEIAMSKKIETPEETPVETFTAEQVAQMKAEALAAKEKELETFKAQLETYKAKEEAQRIETFNASVAALVEEFKSRIPGIEKFSQKITIENSELVADLRELFSSIPKIPDVLTKSVTEHLTENKPVVKTPDPQKM